MPSLVETYERRIAETEEQLRSLRMQLAAARAEAGEEASGRGPFDPTQCACYGDALSGQMVCDYCMEHDWDD